MEKNIQLNDQDFKNIKNGIEDVPYTLEHVNTLSDADACTACDLAYEKFSDEGEGVGEAYADVVAEFWIRVLKARQIYHRYLNPIIATSHT